MKKYLVPFVITLALIILTACSQATPTTISVPVEGTPVPTLAIVQPTQEVQPAPTLSYQPEIFQDDSSGIEIEYPSDWVVVPSQQVGERGAQALLLSPGSTAEEKTKGGSRLFLTTYVWDPKNDLDAYIAQRKTAWDASGFVILSEEEWQLLDGQKAVDFTLETPERILILFTLTTAGENYLQISGDGNLDLCREIVHTLRFVSK